MAIKKKIKSFVKSTKYLFKIIIYLRELKDFLKLKFFSGTNEDIFRRIYLNNSWGDNFSSSGTGSNLKQTEFIIKELPLIFFKYKIKTILDLPCGDFHWMSNVDLKGLNYIGGDILTELIQINQNKFEKMNIKFKLIDLIEDQLPDSDLIFCRDCLVHLSFEDIFKALRNIKKSNIKYFMTTNFNNRNSNKNIATGSWRTINFLEKPFNFPMPLENINENCTEGGNIFKDKSLLLWEIKNLPI